MSSSMSSPLRSSHRRARSHSSTPSASPRNDQWRPASKRIYASPLKRLDQLGSLPSSTSRDLHSQPPEKWDVDMWRRGKRPRRNPSGPDVKMADVQPFFIPTPSSPVFASVPAGLPSTSSAPSTPALLPSTSDAFQFFAYEHKPSASVFDEPSDLSARSRSSSDELLQLHSDAFTDLRRSVAETGEGFVRRMREWEENRSASGPSASRGHPTRNGLHKRGRKRPPPVCSYPRTECNDSDISDIEILSAREASSSGDYSSWNPSKKRALSLGRMELVLTDEPQPLPFAHVHNHGRERSPSPFDPDPGSCPSAYTSDDDDDEFGRTNCRQSQFRYHPPSTASSSSPPLSFTFTNSVSSSLVSLPLLPQHPHSAPPFCTFSPQTSPNVAAYAPSVGATRSERAVAALSLAMANGVGSMSDYAALLSAQGPVASEDRQAGGLWQ